MSRVMSEVVIFQLKCLSAVSTVDISHNCPPWMYFVSDPTNVGFVMYEGQLRTLKFVIGRRTGS